MCGCGRFALVCALLSAAACRTGGHDPPPVVVFAASSLTDALTSVAREYERSSGKTIKTSFAASSTMARQIEAGAPADLFLSAAPEWTRFLETGGFLEERKPFLRNHLVLVAHPDVEGILFSPKVPLPDLWPGNLAVADPEHVPAGRYARQALQRLGWWKGFRGRLVTAADARAALRLVELGEAGLGIVYATDAIGAEVKVLGTFPDKAHEPVIYELGLCRGAGNDARAFFDFLFSTQASDVFKRFGFQNPE